MANCSDAFGTITVEKVGKEFLEFLRTVQGSDEKAYYKLVEVDDLENAKVDENGDLSFSFSTFGRWSYENNLDGYLDGEWMNDDLDKKAYSKFIEALKNKNGRVTVDYTDSDSAMDWMGEGVAQLEVVDNEVRYSEDFHSESINIVKYAQMTGMTEYEAMENLHGDEPAEKYDKYVDQCKKEGKTPLSPDMWYDTEFEWE